MIRPIGTVTGTLHFGGAAPRAASALSALAKAGTLEAIDGGRDGIERIGSELKKLREALLAARKDANSVPGGTTLIPIYADIEQVRDKTTFVTIDGQPVETGTITVSRGTRPVLVGYEVGNRPSLAVRDRIAALSSAVSQFVGTVGREAAGRFAAEVADLLRSEALSVATNAPDSASIDAALAGIDAVLGKAEGLRSSLYARAGAAAQVDLAGMLVNAANAGPASRK
jgi:hypothetical protein